MFVMKQIPFASITLYYDIITFQTPEETLEAVYVPLWAVSDGLHNILATLLHPDPTARATIKEVERHWWLRLPFVANDHRFEVGFSKFSN